MSNTIIFTIGRMNLPTLGVILESKNYIISFDNINANKKKKLFKKE
jgi:hypothetical protein